MNKLGLIAIGLSFGWYYIHCRKQRIRKQYSFRVGDYEEALNIIAKTLTYAFNDTDINKAFIRGHLSDAAFHLEQLLKLPTAVLHAVTSQRFKHIEAMGRAVAGVLAYNPNLTYLYAMEMPADEVEDLDLQCLEEQITQYEALEKLAKLYNKTRYRPMNKNMALKKIREKLGSYRDMLEWA